ncbi:hypothetical protein HPB48_008196 [Haemaphysalis longicornis]|uniref:Myotubularin phosphatase domain-containing protein n=1 Tax=Haemaphysalis longicornis TaxID=44386 RepID=A0A9J6GR10_HAELO|nr:hypothetical protein HPB48_008196 [Haemaphysalis longicornis]
MAVLGGGCEPEVHYPMWTRVHKPIERHTALLESLSKVVEASTDTGVSMDKWLSRLEASGWLGHIKNVLTCACFVAQCLDQDERSVLIHGSEGTDSTLLACSLAQVILDPDCRTMRGFQALVEREWLRGGHPFRLRCQHGAFAPASVRTKDQSPTFLIFLDCVFQIHQQFACSFEFNEQFLIMLFEHSYCSSFGTFLANSMKERKELKLSQKTYSLWSYVNSPDMLAELMNPMYDHNNQVIWPSVAPQSLVLWPALFMRWVYDQKPQKEAWNTILEIRNRDKELRSKAIRLRSAASTGGEDAGPSHHQMSTLAQETTASGRASFSHAPSSPLSSSPATASSGTPSHVRRLLRSLLHLSLDSHAGSRLTPDFGASFDEVTFRRGDDD